MPEAGERSRRRAWQSIEDLILSSSGLGRALIVCAFILLTSKVFLGWSRPSLIIVNLFHVCRSMELQQIALTILVVASAFWALPCQSSSARSTSWV